MAIVKEMMKEIWKKDIGERTHDENSRRMDKKSKGHFVCTQAQR